MFDLILDLVEDFHTVEERRLHRIFGGLADLGGCGAGESGLPEIAASRRNASSTGRYTAGWYGNESPPL